MTVSRAVLGYRPNGEVGVFISPPGVDALTAADSALIMSISNKISQLILLGSVLSSNTISLGLGSQPIVLITTYNAYPGSGAPAPVRPSPVTSQQPNASVTINSGGASMSISSPVKTTYAVYSQVF
jgi:hypothetical protein